MSSAGLQIAVLFPELLGTYGDGGNVLVLQRRLSWHGVTCEVVSIGLGEPVPGGCDLYVLGGGEDRAQTAALAGLHRSPGLQHAAERGTPVLAVCAGLQLLGSSLTDREGVVTAGLGLLDAETRTSSPRLVGEVVAVPDRRLGLPLLTGFTNHAGRTRLGAAARPLATVLTGPGNHDVGRTDPHSEGALQGSIVASYLHGPVLARNSALADLLLGKALGRPLAVLAHAEEQALRRERLPRGSDNASPPTTSPEKHE